MQISDELYKEVIGVLGCLRNDAELGASGEWLPDSNGEGFLAQVDAIDKLLAKLPEHSSEDAICFLCGTPLKKAEAAFESADGHVYCADCWKE